MKKVVSCTLATAIALSPMSAFPETEVKAADDNSILATAEETKQESVDIEVQDTEKIEVSNGNEASENQTETKEEEKVEAEEKTESENEAQTEDKTQTEDKIETEEKTDSVEKVEEDNKAQTESKTEAIENTETKTEDVKKEVKSEPKKVTGKLEFDINLPMPIINSEKIDMKVALDKEGSKIGTIEVGGAESGTLENGATYEIKKLNSKREPLEEGQDDIYFLHIVVSNLELGNYNASITSEGYIDANVKNVEIRDFSKRVKLGTTDNEITRNSKNSEAYRGSLLAGDVNSDSKIDMSDYTLVFENLGSKNSKYDLNKDGVVDIADLTYVNENIGKTQKEVEIINLEAIINPENIQVNEEKIELPEGNDIKDLFVDSEKTVSIGKADGQAPSEENPLVLDINLAGALRSGDSAVDMEQVVIKAPNSEGAPSKGFITYEDENGIVKEVEFSKNTNSRSTGNEDIVIDLGSQVAVKKISINVTGNRGNKNISEIAKIEFLNNVYKELPKPEMNRPQIKTVETSTNLHDERITLTWDPQPNVTSYEVKYEKLDAKGNVTKTKKLQTNEPKINILDKDIRPYDVYRVSVQSLNGDWASGYELETGAPGTEKHPAFDKKPDNVDENYNLIPEYYEGLKGTVTEIQVVPISAPSEPINIVTQQDYRSFTISWENHIQARQFDVYYRKIGDTNKKWIKANQNKIEVEENSPEVTNPDKKYLINSHSYTVNGLEDRASYEVRVTATNHLGTSKMSKTYIASTEALDPPVSSNYKLINRPTDEGEIGTTNIVAVENRKNDSGIILDSENAVVDNDYGTTWVVNHWESSSLDRGTKITFNQEYKMDTITIVPNLQKGYPAHLYQLEVNYWEEDGVKKTINPTKFTYKTSNGKTYVNVKFNEPIVAKQIQVNPLVYGGEKVSISELKFYEYDSIEDDIKNLYTDNLRLVLKDEVEQSTINALVERVNTKDEVSGEYHPNREILQKELDTAQKLLNDKKVSDTIVKLDPAIRTNNGGPSLGMNNDWQSLGAVARPGKAEDGNDKQIVVYMGSSNPNAEVEITFLQSYGQPGKYQAGTTTIRPGRTEITIPSIITADVEKGGVVMARVKKGGTNDDIQLRLSGIDEIPHLNVNNLINDDKKVDETKALIRKYIQDLKTYVDELPSKYEDSVKDEDKINNIYTYDAETSPLNSTDIEGDRFTLTLPATQILEGIKSGLDGDIEKEVQRVYDALLAWEQEMQVAFAKKGVYEKLEDFNGDEVIDEKDTEIFNKHKAPSTRLNIKYQRMVMGAAAYASGHHIGVGYGTVPGLIQGVPYRFNDQNEVTNAEQAHLYGDLIGHELGHVMDIGNRLYPETSNNLMAAITGTMLDEDSSKTAGVMNEVYKKVTSNTHGLSTNRNVVLAMLWQPHLAYDNDSTYKMLFNDSDGNSENDSYYAKLNRAYREMTEEEKRDGDRDQWLIRMSSKVVGKNLSKFYLAHGIVPNETTLRYVSQFDPETRPIQYLNDEARRMRMAGNATMSPDTTLSASFGDGIKAGSYVNQKEVPFELSVNKDEDKILGYEIYRNGQPAGFVLRDKENSVTKYNDVIDSLNNRVFEYEVVAYDYNLNPTNRVKLGAVKVRHEGGVDNGSITLKSNTIDKTGNSNDIHGDNPNAGLEKMLDKEVSTVYEGRKLTKDEYNSSIHGQDLNPNADPYVILDANELRTLVGIKYTAPTSESGFIFKKSKLAKTAIDKYKIEVSTDGTNWTKVNEGNFDLSGSNPTETIYFGKEGVEGGKQLNAYNARYVKLTAVGASELSIAELELLAPPGDNIEIGVSENNIDYVNGIGILEHDYIYQANDPDTDEDETLMIPKNSILITGEYRGNPAFNVPLVLNQDENHIADVYDGILLAELPTEGNLEEISKGTWLYWVTPENAETFMQDNKEIFAELYRTDSADASEGGQRLVSDTFKITVPNELPKINLNSESKLRAGSNVKVTKINKDLLKEITNNR